VLVFIFTLLLLLSPKERRRLDYFGAAAWLFSLLGLLTGMAWAQSAWGSYWSWDPKETATLAYFIAVSAMLVAHFEKRPRLSLALGAFTCALALVTVSTSWLLEGLHSYLG